MQKIISLFKRNYEGDRLVMDEIVAGAEWVTNGEGTATRKWDGMAATIINEELFKRYDVKKGKQVPIGAIPCQDPDEITGHHPHWIKCQRNNPEDKYFWIGFDNLENKENWTYELCGVKVQGNPERIENHVLIPHGKEILEDVPRTFDAIREYFKVHNIEGIVWWHGDGRMVKIKAKDFGLKRVQTAI